jgi:hypothetical protein
VSSRSSLVRAIKPGPLPGLRKISSIIPRGDGHFSTAKPFSPTADEVSKAD